MLEPTPNENFGFITPLMVASSCGSLLSIEDLFASCGYKYRVHVDLSANIVRQLFARGEQQKGLEWPITCSAELIKLLLYHGAQVDWQGRFGWTALHMAAKADRVDSIRALLKGGANINLVDTRGRSALTKASDNASKSAIKFLLENGATPLLHISTAFGNLLNSAAFSGSIPLLETLLSTKQVNCNLKDDVGRNAAHFAALGGNLATLEFLQRVGTDLDSVDVTGKSLVHYAAMGCNQEILRIALSQDNHRTTSDSPGWSPLHWVCRRGDSSIVKLLLQYGLMPTEVSTLEPPYKWSPLSIAAFYENKNILEDPSENWARSGQLGTCDLNQLPENFKQYIIFCDICREVSVRDKFCFVKILTL